MDANLDALQSLVDKSLLRFSGERFWMLETIREYATERLEQFEDAEALRRRHAEYFLRLAEEAEPHLTGRQQATWLDRLEADHDNLRLSQDSLRHAGLGAEELELVGALMRFWYVRGYLREGRSRCEEALAAHDDQSPPRLKALFGAGLLAHRLGDYRHAEALMRERLALARQLEDAEGVASSMVGIGYERPSARRPGASSSVLCRGRGACARGRLHLGPRGGHQQPGAISHRSRATTRRRRLSKRKASDSSASSATSERSRRASSVSASSRLARAGATRPQYLLRESLEYAEALVDKEIAIWCLEELAALAVSGGEAERAARLLGAIETLREETGHAGTPEERRLAEQTRSALATELGKEQLAAAVLIGREMTFEQTMVFALQN